MRGGTPGLAPRLRGLPYGIHLNILLAWHEDQNVSRGAGEVHLEGLLHCRLHVVLLRSLEEGKTVTAHPSHSPAASAKGASSEGRRAADQPTSASHLAEEDIHGERAARDVKNGHVPKESSKLLCIHRGRGNNQLQV